MIVGGLAVTGIAGLVSWIWGSGWIGGTWRFLVTPVAVPLAILVVLVGSLGWFALGALGRAATVAPEIPWRDYTEDEFLGVLWRWRYSGSRLLESSLTPYCRSCGLGMIGTQTGYSVEPQTTLVCEDCRLEVPIRGSMTQVVDRVARKIELEIRRRFL